jgi:hydrogenase-4 component F
MALLLVLLPILGAATALAIPSNRYRPWILPLTGFTHLLAVIYTMGLPEVEMFSQTLKLDPVGRVFLPYISVLFFISSCYAPTYLALRVDRDNRVLCTCLQLQLGMMTLVVLAHHLGLMWVAIEATTLATTPAIYFNRNPRSLEASWKYMLLCSVGVAIALLGSFFLAYAALDKDGHTTLLFDDLVREAHDKLLNRQWLHAAFLLLFIGYGAKMGLAPMHTWKPDAYGEAPGMHGAILAGGVTSCAFLAILRCYHICLAAGDTLFPQRIMIFMGLFSMVLAAISMARQRDLKRILAYSSVEHMGIIIFGMGIGTQAAIAGALLHVIHNGLTKGVMFLSAGNIHRAYGSKETAEISGVLHRLPFSGAMLIAGFFAVTAAPPFACFVSEFQIISAAFDSKHYIAGGIFVACLLLVFIGMGAHLVRVCFGTPHEEGQTTGFHDRLGTSLPIAAFMALVLLLGVYYPPQLQALIDSARDFILATKDT